MKIIMGVLSYATDSDLPRAGTSPAMIVILFEDLGHSMPGTIYLNRWASGETGRIFGSEVAE
jgi:hypothetical protein